jgi:hypothetical protein
LQLAQQLADRRVVWRSFEHQVFEVLGHEQVVDQRLLDAFGNLSPLLFRLSTLNTHWLGSAKFQRCSTAKRSKRFFRMSRRAPWYSVCSFLYSGFWPLHSCAFISARARISRSRSRKALVEPARQQEADGVAALLQVIFDPAAQALVELVRFLWQHQNGQAVVPFVGMLGFIERGPGIGLPGLRQRDHAEGLGDLVGAADHVATCLASCAWSEPSANSLSLRAQAISLARGFSSSRNTSRCRLGGC